MQSDRIKRLILDEMKKYRLAVDLRFDCDSSFSFHLQFIEDLLVVAILGNDAFRVKRFACGILRSIDLNLLFRVFGRPAYFFRGQRERRC